MSNKIIAYKTQNEDNLIIEYFSSVISDDEVLAIHNNYLSDDNYIEPLLLEKELVPQDKHFRNAWDIINDVIEVDMVKARLIHMDKLRIIRNKKLLEKDVEYIKALEFGDQALASEIATIKQELRDLPETYDLSVYTNPEELKEAKPNYLN